MSDKVWRLTFKPLTGSFELERKILSSGGGGSGGGTLTSGTLVFPGGVSFTVTEGIAMTGSGEITLDPFSEIVVLT